MVGFGNAHGANQSCDVRCHCAGIFANSYVRLEMCEGLSTADIWEPPYRLGNRLRKWEEYGVCARTFDEAYPRSGYLFAILGNM